MSPIEKATDEIWKPETNSYEHHIYGDDLAQQWAIVDVEDYQWAVQWRWCVNIKKSRGNPNKTKKYLKRSVNEWNNGVRIKTFSLYLHIEIMKRAEPISPSKHHMLVDHRDGDTSNCKRSNLRWATHSMNSKNRFGTMPWDLIED